MKGIDYNNAQLPDTPERKLAERFAGKGEDIDVKFKDAADNVCLIGLIAALILSLLIGDRFDGILGVLIGFMVAAVSLTVTFLSVRTLYSYGDMIAVYAEQMKILRQLEARKALELFISGKPELPAAEEAAAGETAPAGDDSTEAEAEQDFTEAADAEQADDSQGTVLTVDIANRIAYFTKRFDVHMVCPVCNRRQSAERNSCFFCGCQYIYDEAQQSLNKSDLERLRRFLLV